MMRTTQLFTAIAFITAFSVQWAAGAEKGSIRGTVIDQSTKQPMVGANVFLVGTIIGASTDGEGRFVIQEVDENVYKIRTSFVGYLPTITTDVRVVRDKSTSLELELAEDFIKSEEVTVSSTPFLVDRIAPVSNYAYSREEINRSPGAGGDIFRAIETLPGVSSSGEFSAFSVRGGSPKDNIVLVDNIPVDRLTHFEGGSEEQEAQGGRFSVFAPRVVEEAKFQAGGFPARYGGKNASFVDLRLREGNREDVTVNGTYDVIGWELNYDGPAFVAPNTGVMVSARHQDFRTILRMTDQKDLGDPSFTDLSLKSTTDVSPNHRVSLVGIVSPEWFDRTMGHVYESENVAQTELQQLKEQKYLGGVNWRFLTGTSSFLQSTFFYKQRNSTYTEGRAYTDGPNGTTRPEAEATSRNVFSFDGVEKELGVKSSYTLEFGSMGTMTTGIEISEGKLDYERTQFGLDTLYSYDRNDYRPDPARQYVLQSPESFDAWFDQAAVSGALFLEHSFTVGDALAINPGIRFERTGFNDREEFAPRLSASYALNHSTRINAAAGLYYQSPDVMLYSEDPRNSMLENERAVHTILGISRYGRKTAW